MLVPSPIQLALVARDAHGETLWEREWCVCDAPPCQSQASRYHGLEDERLRSDGLPIAVVLTYLLDAMRLLCHDKGRLVSHNLEFDGGTLLGEYRRLALASTIHEPLEYPDPSACCPNSPLSVRRGGEIYTYTYSCSLLTASKCPLGATDQWTEASNLLAQLASAGACTFAMYAPLDLWAIHGPAYVYMHSLRARRSHSCAGHESFKCRQSLSSRPSHGHARAPECRCLRPLDHAAHIPPYTMRGYTRRCTSVYLRWPTEEPLSPCSIGSRSMPREMASCGSPI